MGTTNEAVPMGLTVDGVSEVLAAVREQLRQGATQVHMCIGFYGDTFLTNTEYSSSTLCLSASRNLNCKIIVQIKLTVSGGVLSLYDPLDSLQFTMDEIRAAVQAAEDWGTYVMVHAYHPKVHTVWLLCIGGCPACISDTRLYWAA